MKLFKTSFFFLIFPFILSCSLRGGYAPTSLSGSTYSLYQEHTSGKFDEDIYHKDVIFKFKDDGTYTSSVDGKPYEYGNYSYDRIEGNKGRVILSYSVEDATYTYGYTLDYKSNSSGTWVAAYSTNPGVPGKEYGTFKVIHQGKEN